MHKYSEATLDEEGSLLVDGILKHIGPLWYVFHKYTYIIILLQIVASPS